MTAEYDEIAEAYNRTHHNAIRMSTYYYSRLKHIGEITGKDAVDFGCGNGLVTRELKLRGCRRVVGVDTSPVQIRAAAAIESANPLGIEYVCCDGKKFAQEEAFDTAVGSFYFHYAKNKAELAEMFATAAKALKPNGRLVALNRNPLHPGEEWHGLQVDDEWLDEPFGEGSRLRLTLTDDTSGKATFVNYYYPAATYAGALKAAGFKDWAWHDLEASQEGRRQLDKMDWAGFDACEHAISILTATKR